MQKDTALAYAMRKGGFFVDTPSVSFRFSLQSAWRRRAAVSLSAERYARERKERRRPAPSLRGAKRRGNPRPTSFGETENGSPHQSADWFAMTRDNIPPQARLRRRTMLRLNGQARQHRTVLPQARWNRRTTSRIDERARQRKGRSTASTRVRRTVTRNADSRTGIPKP